MREEFVATIDAYNISADAYAQTIARLKNYDETYEFFANCLKENDRILDLGCGPATVSSILTKARDRLSITGIDLSLKMLELAKEAVPQGTFICSNIIDFESEVKFDAAIIGFAIPYLNKAETETLLKKTCTNLKDAGYLYLSFMNGDKEGFEIPSFDKNVKLYIYYHMQNQIEEMLKTSSFEIIKKWQLDYHESDGRITTDVVIIARKQIATEVSQFLL